MELFDKIRHYVPKFQQRTLYYAALNSHLMYFCQMWRHNETIVRKILQLQNKDNNDNNENNQFQT